MGEPNTCVEGFADPSDVDDISNHDVNTFMKNKKSTGKKLGGFQGMGLSYPVLKGVQKRGYKIPTPIQRKTIPLVIEGRDVVAMARTGSGKTACFLIPMFEKLKTRSAKAGVRALVLAPTRELALQTHRFIKELGRFMDLKATLILGGDSMEQQFDALHGSPDIIVATPGRFLHVCVEMDLKLNGIEYVVFDEADRLFEMGFGEQLREILARLPDSRQTLLFSATLPKLLVEFARAGLSDPVLLRLDVDSKIPETLKLGFISCCSEEKQAALLSLLRYVIPENSQTAVFVPTKHHVDYIYLLLCKAGLSATYVYSDLDPSARKINAAKFVTGKAKILVVTDVAARGIDIPCLDTVINYNFPPKPKLFVHRVGRCARAGRSGTAYSLVTGEERPYLLDLHLFLGRPLVLAPTRSSSCTESEEWESGTIGRIPQEPLEEENIELIRWHETSSELVSMKKVCSNAYGQYLRSRPGASIDSVRRAKEVGLEEVGVHPAFLKMITTKGNGIDCKAACSSVPFAETSSRISFLEQVRSYRPLGTVFEVGRRADVGVFAIMREKREKHDGIVKAHRQKLEKGKTETLDDDTIEKSNDTDVGNHVELASSNAEEIDETFKQVIAPKKRRFKERVSKKRQCMDRDHFIPYSAPDHHTEQGLAVNNFDKDAIQCELDLDADNEDGQKLGRKLQKWDRRKKKMVNVQDNKSKKIRTESGVWIPATYRSGRYEQWKGKSKVSEGESEEDEYHEENGRGKRGPDKTFPGRKMKGFNKRGDTRRQKSNVELKKPEQILKLRKMKESRERDGRRGGRSRGGGGRNRGGGGSSRGGDSRSWGGGGRSRGGGSSSRGGGSSSRGGGGRSRGGGGSSSRGGGRRASQRGMN